MQELSFSWANLSCKMCYLVLSLEYCSVKLPDLKWARSSKQCTTNSKGHTTPEYLGAAPVVWGGKPGRWPRTIACATPADRVTVRKGKWRPIVRDHGRALDLSSCWYQWCWQRWSQKMTLAALVVWGEDRI